MPFFFGIVLARSATFWLKIDGTVGVAIPVMISSIFRNCFPYESTKILGMYYGTEVSPDIKL